MKPNRRGIQNITWYCVGEIAPCEGSSRQCLTGGIHERQKPCKWKGFCVAFVCVHRRVCSVRRVRVTFGEQVSAFTPSRHTEQHCANTQGGGGGRGRWNDGEREIQSVWGRQSGYLMGYQEDLWDQMCVWWQKHTTSGERYTHPQWGEVTFTQVVQLSTFLRYMSIQPLYCWSSEGHGGGRRRSQLIVGREADTVHPGVCLYQ